MHHEKILDIWKRRESLGNMPSTFKDVIEISFDELEEIYLNQNSSRILKLVERIIEGDFLIIRAAFSYEEIIFMKKKMEDLMNKTNSTFYKMDSLIPDFWRNITSEHSHKYGVPVVKKSGGQRATCLMQ